MRGRYVDKKIQTFNQRAIADWNNEIANNPAAIEQHQLVIQAHQAALDNNQQSMRELVSRITPKDSRITGLEARIKVLTLPATIDDLEQQVTPHQIRVDELLPQLNSIEMVLAPINADMNRLSGFIEIRRAQQLISHLLLDIDADTHAITDHQEELHRLQHELSDISSQLRTAEDQLSDLRTSQMFGTASHMAHGFDHHHGHHGYHHYNTFHAANDFTASANISSLQSQVNNHKSQIHSLNARIQDLVSKVSHHENNRTRIRRQIQDHQSRIAQLENQLSGYTCIDDLRGLEIKLEQKRVEKLPHEEAKIRLNNEMVQHKRDIDSFQRKKSQLKADYDQSLRLSHEFAVETDLASLREQLEVTKKVRQQLEDEKVDLDAKISVNQRFINTVDQSIRTVEHRQQELHGNQFLITLRDRPDLLIDALNEEVRKRFTSYELEHPAGQSENIQLCLADTEKKLQIILSQSRVNENEMRQKYYQLCGMLWLMVDTVDGGEDLELAAQMMAILRLNPVDPEEAKIAYRHLQNSCVDNLRDMTSEQLSILRFQEYDQAYSHLHNMLNQIQDNAPKEFIDLREKGKAVLTSINDRKLEAIRKDDASFDIKFHTKILNQTAAVACYPDNQQFRQNYRKLIKHNKDGKRSLGKQILGLVFMFLGAVAIAACAVAKALSMGASSFVTTSGMVGGGALLLKGMGLFGWGMQKGTSKKMAKFETAAERASGEIQNVRLTEATPLRLAPV